MAPSGTALRAAGYYWASFNDAAGFPRGDQGHLVLGGERRPFSLAGRPGDTWPRPGAARPAPQLPLPRLITVPQHGGGTYVDQRPARVLRHARVDGVPALVLAAPAYPQGGLMGGHVIVLWNADGHG